MLNAGDVGEHIFIADALSRGLLVSKPVLSHCQYDVVVDGGGKLHRVQVKWFENPHRIGSNQFALRGRNRGYVEKDFDVLAIRFPGESQWCIMPNGIVSKCIRNGAKNKVYFDNWSIFTNESHRSVHEAALPG